MSKSTASRRQQKSPRERATTQREEVMMMNMSEVKEVREVIGADAANELLRQGWVLLEVRPSESMVAYGEDGFSYLLGSAADVIAPSE